MRVVLTIDNRVVDLLSEDYDVAIRIGPLADSDLIARRLATLRLWPYASPAYLAANAPVATPADLHRHRLIAHGHPDETWRFRNASGTLCDIKLAAPTVVPEPDVVRSLLLGGAGIGMLPDFHARDAIASGRLIRILPDWESGSVEAHALYPSHRSLSAKVRVFVNALVASLDGAGPAGRA